MQLDACFLIVNDAVSTAEDIFLTCQIKTTREELMAITKQYHSSVGFEVHMAAAMNGSVFRDIRVCSMVKVNGQFRGTYSSSELKD
jgi:hypothetical protein